MAHEALRRYEEVLQRLHREDSINLAPLWERSVQNLSRRETDAVRAYIRDVNPADAERARLLAVDGELEATSRDLGKKIRSMKPSEDRQEAERPLRSCLEEHFDLRLEFREAEILDLEKKIDALRDEFERRATQKKRLIQRRWEDLTGLGADPGW